MEKHWHMEAQAREPSNVPQSNMKSNPPAKTNGTGRRVTSRVCLGRDPFLNFLREFRKRNPELSTEEALRRSAIMWKGMTREEKQPFIATAIFGTKTQNATPAKNKDDVSTMSYDSGSDSDFEPDPDEKCPRRRKKRCPCPPKRRRRRCPRRRPKRRPCCKRRRRRRRC